MELLALTEQFDDGVGGHLASARQVLQRLHSPYDRAYYAGIISERHAKSLLRTGGIGGPTMAHQLLHEAMGHYAEAEALRQSGNDDPVLRWNACARLLMRDGADVPQVEDRFEPFLE